MYFFKLSFVYITFQIFSCDSNMEFPTAAADNAVKCITADSSKINTAEPETSHIIYQSKDGGQTWDNISQSLPENAKPEGFFTNEKEMYLRVKNSMYRSINDFKNPVWTKEYNLDKGSTSIAFNPSGVFAYNYEGQIYQKINSTGTWLPVFSNFKKQLLRTIFESSNGTLFIGCDSGLYKSTDKGQNWTHVLNEGWVMKLVEEDGVIVGTGEKGIMRSTDNGDQWNWVIREGGVGIDIEKINGGFAAITYNTTSKTRRMRVSMDKGVSWQDIDHGIQASESISSILMIGKYLICGHPNGILRSADMGKTWNKVLPTIGKKVFEVYSAGNVLYAIPRDFGC